MVVITFDHDQGEHYRALLAIHRSSPSWWFWPGGALLFGGYGVYHVVRYWGQYPARYVLLIALPWLLFGVVWALFVPLSFWASAKRARRTSPGQTGRQERVLDDASYHSRDGGVNVNVAWDVMHRAIETREFLLFFVSRKAADYIPKRAMDPQALVEARKLLRSALGDRAHLPG